MAGTKFQTSWVGRPGSLQDHAGHLAAPVAIPRFARQPQPAGRLRGERSDYQWRKESPIRPVVFNRPDGIDDDIEELLPHLEQRGQDAKAEAEAKLKKRGDDEADSIRRVLEDQKRRLLAELGRYDQAQLLLTLDLEKRQLESNRRYWDKWLANAEGDLQREPDRVRKFYAVASFRIEPVGLAYLWPVTG